MTDQPGPAAQDEADRVVARRKAEAEAGRAEAELEEWKSPSARAAREAERQAAASKATREQLPDLTQVDRGSLTAPESGTLFGSVIGLHVLTSVASSVTAAVIASAKVGAGDTGTQFLITTDAHFAASDGLYIDVVQNLTVLENALTALLGPDVDRKGWVPGALGAAASLVPAALSLVASHRSVTSEALSLDTTAAAASVAAALASRGHSVWHDDVRVLPSPEKSRLLQRLADLQARRPALDAAMEDALTTTEATRLAAMMDAFMTALSTAAPSTGRSLLVDALLRERLHQETGSATKVYLVWIQGVSGSAQQVIDDRPLFFEDKMSTLVSVGVTFLLVDASTGQVCGGGTKVDTRVLSGEIGSTFGFAPFSPTGRG